LSDDDSLLRALLMPIDKPTIGTKAKEENLKIINNRLNAWLGGAGMRVMEDVENEEFEDTTR